MKRERSEALLSVRKDEARGFEIVSFKGKVELRSLIGLLGENLRINTMESLILAQDER